MHINSFPWLSAGFLKNKFEKCPIPMHAAKEQKQKEGFDSVYMQLIYIWKKKNQMIIDFAIKLHWHMITKKFFFITVSSSLIFWFTFKFGSVFLFSIVNNKIWLQRVFEKGSVKLEETRSTSWTSVMEIFAKKSRKKPCQQNQRRPFSHEIFAVFLAPRWAVSIPVHYVICIRKRATSRLSGSKDWACDVPRI